MNLAARFRITVIRGWSSVTGTCHDMMAISDDCPLTTCTHHMRCIYVNCCCSSQSQAYHAVTNTKWQCRLCFTDIVRPLVHTLNCSLILSLARAQLKRLSRFYIAAPGLRPELSLQANNFMPKICIPEAIQRRDKTVDTTSGQKTTCGVHNCCNMACCWHVAISCLSVRTSTYRTPVQ